MFIVGVMNRYIISLLIVSVFVFQGCCSRTERAKQAATIENLQKHVQYLSSDECMGRQPFTAGADRAVGYLEEQMREIGLEPVCADGSFLQQVPLVMFRTEAQPTMEINTGSGPIVLHKGEDYVAFTQSRKETVEVKDAELIFAGYGLVAPEYGKDDYRGLEDPSDKIAVVIVNDPGLGTEGEYFCGDAMTYYGRWTYKFEEGTRQNLAGVLIVHDDRGAGYGWNVVAGGAGLEYGLDEQNEDKEKCPLQGWLSASAAKKLFDACGYDIDSLKTLAKAPDFKPFSLNAKTGLSMTSKFSYAQSPNVVGYIPGQDGTQESIICIAHWDHLGVTESPTSDGDSIINGATDNATAMAWLLETARAFKAMDSAPLRNIVFLCPTCEEEGMWGSEYYVSHPVFPVQKTVAVVNLDVVPLWGENNDVTITGYGHTDMDERVARIAKKYGRYVMPDPDAFNGMFYRSDHLPFMRQGVPAMFAKGWSDNRLHGKEWSFSKIKDYWANTYHSPYDQLDPLNDDYSGLKQEVDLFFDLICSYAYSDDYAHWKEGSEFYVPIHQ